MNEPYHPWLAALSAAAQPNAAGVLVLEPAVHARALHEATQFDTTERERVAFHTVAFARALHQTYGAAVAELIAQLVQIAAAALVDKQRVRDAFAGSGLDAATLERALGQAPNNRPAARDASAPSLLDVRLKRR